MNYIVPDILGNNDAFSYYKTFFNVRRANNNVTSRFKLIKLMISRINFPMHYKFYSKTKHILNLV